MHKDGTLDEFDRDREEFEDRVQLAKQAPLDLRAVEARLTTCSIAQLRTDTAVLLAHVRALRAALRVFAEMPGAHLEQREAEQEFGFFLSAPSPYTTPAFKVADIQRAAAVLAQAQDDP